MTVVTAAPMVGLGIQSACSRLTGEARSKQCSGEMMGGNPYKGMKLPRDPEQLSARKFWPGTPQSEINKLKKMHDIQMMTRDDEQNILSLAPEQAHHYPETGGLDRNIYPSLWRCLEIDLFQSFLVLFLVRTELGFEWTKMDSKEIQWFKELMEISEGLHQTLTEDILDRQTKKISQSLSMTRSRSKVPLKALETHRQIIKAVDKDDTCYFVEHGGPGQSKCTIFGVHCIRLIAVVVEESQSTTPSPLLESVTLYIGD
ncbi:hypothetical protein C8J56DRAFT_900203 [Mycena floridula]|nr:hypothetical protein C8J56DRAFT_900203 [Mycena floridula]